MNLIKKIFFGVGSVLGLVNVATAAHAPSSAPISQKSALSKKSETAKIAQSIKNACGGTVTNSNIGGAIVDGKDLGKL